MISLDEEIKKDRDRNGNRRGNNRYQSRERSRERYRSRDGRWNHNQDEERRHDYSRKHYHSNKYEAKTEKTIVKFTQLHYSVTKEQLKSLCEKYGALKFCKIHWDKMGRSKETAVVGYMNEYDAQKAANEMNHMKFEDMQIVTELCSTQRNDQRNNQEENWRSGNRNNNNRRFYTN